MQLQLRFRHLEASPSLVEHIQRGVHFQLSRFGRQVSTVVVRLSDVNGPKGGVDKLCQVSVRGPLLGTVTVVSESGDAQSAVELVLERLGRAVGRALERARQDGRADLGHRRVA